MQVDERSAAAILSRVPADLPQLERVRLRAGTTLHGDLLIAQPIHLCAEEGVQLVGQLRLDGGSSRGSGSSHKANIYKWDEPPARRHTGSKLGKSVHVVGVGARTESEEVPAKGARHGEAGLVARAIEESRLSQIVGVIEGLSLGHYMEPAIRVQRGRWKLVRMRSRDFSTRCCCACTCSLRRLLLPTGTLPGGCQTEGRACQHGHRHEGEYVALTIRMQHAGECH